MASITVSIEKPFLKWTVECYEKDPHSALPSFYYCASVVLNPEVLAWCDENLSARPVFLEDRYDICQDCFSQKSVEIPVATLLLRFSDVAEATLFKLRWC